MLICTVKIPIGSLPKSIATENENEVLGMYWARIDVADESPLTICTLSTLSHLSWQIGEFRRVKGRKLALTLRRIFP